MNSAAPPIGLRRLPPGASRDIAAPTAAVDRVLICGAGPTGLTLALDLARRGVPVTVLEKGADLSAESRASTLHPPTLELLDELGVIEPVLRDGLRAPTTQFRDRSLGPIVDFDLGVLADDTAYPFRVQLEQNKLARILLDELRSAGLDAEVRFEHRAHGVRTHDRDGVALLVGTAEDRRPYEVWHAPWVVGCEGAHSAVRDSVGIASVGETYPERYLVVSVADELHALLPDLAFVNYVADPQEWLVLLRTPDHWRVLFPVDVADEATATEPAEVRRRLNGITGSARDWSVLASSLYVVQRCVVDTMRRGRVLLAGDAAHQNSPLGGMGMNSGIQDAVALARRLASVWHGDAADTVLDDYDQLRREVATGFVHADSHANYLALREPDPDRRAALQAELRAIATDPVRHRERMLRTAMLDAVRSHL